MIEMVIWDADFIEKEEGFAFEWPIKFSRAIPPQMSQAAFEVVSQATETTKEATSVALGPLLAMNFIQTLSLSYVLGVINAMQITLHLPLVKVPFPSHVFCFNKSLIELAKFDLIDWDIHATLVMPDEDPYSQELDFLEISGKSLFNNVSALVIFFCILIIYGVLVKPTQCLGCQKLSSKLQSMLYWNGWILFFLEGGFEFSFAFFIEWASLSERRPTFVWANYLSLAMATAFFLVFLGLGLWTRFYLRANFSSLGLEET